MVKSLMLVVLGLVLVGLYLRRSNVTSVRVSGKPTRKLSARKAANGSSRAGASKTSKPYQSVSIRSRLGACNAALDMRDDLRLATEAPTLPLANCDAETCECRYAYHDDRRQDDRRSPFGAGGLMGGSTASCREQGDRRQ